MAIHPIAVQGFGEGTTELYDRIRPSYQPSVLSYIRHNIPPEHSPPLNVVEIGSGTGIFTRALLAHPEWENDIAEIRAVDPSKGMRDQFEKSVIIPRKNTELGNNNKVNTITVAEGTFTATGIEDEWADMIVMAQAYHWAHPDYASAQTEFHRILKPTGIVAYVWNRENPEKAKWIGLLWSLYGEYDGDVPQSRHGWWRATFDPEVTPVYRTLFEEQVEKTFDWVVPTTEERVVERVRSKSYVAVLERERKDEYDKLVEKVGEVMGGEDKKWIDREKGMFEYPYQTIVIVSRKRV